MPAEQTWKGSWPLESDVLFLHFEPALMHALLNASDIEASRVELRQYGVGVTTVNPGFVVTAMTEKNRFKMPFLMKVDDAARVIVDGLERGKRVIEFPRPMSMLMRFARLVPDAIYDRAVTPYGKRKIQP